MGGILAELGGAVPVGAGALLAVTVLLIFRGALVPRLYYDQLQKAADKKDETIAELMRQNRMLLDAGLTTQKIVESLPPPPSGG